MSSNIPSSKSVNTHYSQASKSRPNHSTDTDTPSSTGQNDPALGSEEKTHPIGPGQPTSFQCQHLSSSPGRNLVVCIDGTANQFSRKNTNVVEFGIGTFASNSKLSWSHWKQTFNHSIDMAIAWNFKRIVLSAYQWLSEMYEDGDRIFLFGFSRGAYQVRVIAGMIERVGLLHKGNNDQIAFAYELYVATTESSNRADSDNKNPPTGLFRKWRQRRDSAVAEKAELCARFKKTLSRHDVKVHFVGVWDTVSSIGFARGQSYPETTSGMGHVCVFRHAMALDELRVKFLPEYADGGAGPSGGGNVKEVWFRGSHSDIGGGNTANMELDKFGPALRWMTYESIEHGLMMTPYQGEWSDLNPTKSLTGIWHILEIFPFRRLSYKDKEGTTRWPHLGRPRLIQNGQLIHQSVVDSMTEGYLPRARLSDQLLQAFGLSSGSSESYLTAEILEDSRIKEDDVYTSAGTILKDMSDIEKFSFNTPSFNLLITLTASKIGLRSITESPGSLDAIIAALDNYRSHHEHSQKNMDVQKALMKALIAFPCQPLDARNYSNKQIKTAVEGLSNTPAVLNKLYCFLGNNPFHGHTSIIFSVAYSPDGTHIASASWDRTIRIWDSQTGDSVMGPLNGHTSEINSVAFSPDGARLASGSWDYTVRIWDLKTGLEAIISPLKGHYKWVFSVSFSPDGKRIASGSADRTVRVWDAQTGKEAMEPLWGHRDSVHSVAFSPDGRHIASGSYDNTIRVWDAKTGKPTLGPLEGHSGAVSSISFSPNSKYIASGSADRTVRLWDAVTGKQVMEPFMGHTDWVWSVAFSHDGARIVSSAEDKTIRVWDATTGKAIMEPFWGDRFAVSPDGQQITGSGDQTIRVWDMKTGEQLLGPVEW